ncbi:sulfatase-like hydrolase/transferase [Capnocytophaga canis]|uniref:sulfatase-like hydrolase/transferase n=1 Tax=Capnocytophaga canis TaxID=1848903 RepID=UPI0015629C8C|nr:sulfatase-like hydrolase/transferase [Capnocytophaga canis]
MKKHWLKVSFFCLLTFVLSCKSTEKKGKTVFPNVILIYADDLGYGDLSSYGGKIATPHIDRLADHGILHCNAYAAASTCTPSRYTLLTGEYAWREKGRGVINGNEKALIPRGRQTVASVFKKAGYTTAVIGKWHLGLGDENGIDWNTQISNIPEDIGFDESFIMPATSDRVPCVYVSNGKVLNLDPTDTLAVSYQKKIGNLPTGKENPELLKLKYSHGHDMTIVNGISRIGYQSGGMSAVWKDENIADDFVRESKKFIIKNKQKPFFLYLATNNIHVPRMPHPRFQGKTSQGLRGDAILELDDMVGSISKTLDSLQIAENTIIIFSSDNGAVLDDGYADQAIEKSGEHNPFGALRGAKYSVYEAGTRIPMIVSWKGNIKKQTSQALVSQTDFIASVGAMLNVRIDSNQAFDAKNQWDSWIGKDKKGRSEIVQEAIQNTLSIVEGDYKYIEPSKSKMKVAWQTGIETGFSDKPQLYNLKQDPAEKVNLAEQQPQLVIDLAKKLDSIKNQHKGK